MGANITKVRCRLTNTETGTQTILYKNDGDMTTFELSELSPYTQYRAEIAPEVNGAYLTFTSPYTFTTLPLSQSSHPVSYDTTNYAWSSVSSTYPIDRGYDDYDSTTYTRIYWVNGADSETYVYFNFNLNIPSNAVIQSVVCRAKSATSTGVSAYVTQRTLQLYSGSTAKGTPQYMTTQSSHNIEFSGSNIGTWTADELNNAKIKLFIKRGSGNVETNYFVNFYGATLEVEYLI